MTETFAQAALSGERKGGAFSSEVGTGSREENATKQKSRAVFGLNWIGNRSSARLRSRFAVPAWSYGLILPIAFALAWELAARAGFVQARLMPPPSRIGETLYALLRNGDLIAHSAATLTRVGLGFALGAAAGTLAGALCGASFGARRLLDPTIQALRAIPSIAWVPLFIL